MGPCAYHYGLTWRSQTSSLTEDWNTRPVSSPRPLIVFQWQVLFYTFSRMILWVFCWIIFIIYLIFFQFRGWQDGSVGRNVFYASPTTWDLQIPWEKERANSQKLFSGLDMCRMVDSQAHIPRTNNCNKLIFKNKKFHFEWYTFLWGGKEEIKSHYAVQPGHMILLPQPPQLLGFSEHTTPASSGQHLQAIRSQLCSNPKGASMTPSRALLTAQNPWFSCS